MRTTPWFALAWSRSSTGSLNRSRREAGTGKTAVAAASRLKPDVMVLDLDMPDTCDPLLPREQTASEVLAASPTTKIIILTMHDDPSTVRDLLRAGVSGYLAKTAGPDELRVALNATARGDESILSRYLAERCSDYPTSQRSRVTHSRPANWKSSPTSRTDPPTAILPSNYTSRKQP
ncbi:MAG: response regulator transcription factor [Nocardioides sp.]